MESQLQRPSHDHRRFGQDPQHAGLHSVIEGEGEEQQHEHKSVLKKVKDKAKKIKDKISKHQHQQGDEDIYEEDNDEDEEEEVVNDPEFHGAPMYETTVIRSIDVPPKTNSDKAGHVKTGPMATEPRDPIVVEKPRPIKHDEEESKLKIGPPMGLEEDPHSPYNTPQASNYQSKVSDPTASGGNEADVSPLVRQLGKMNVDERPDSEKSTQEKTQVPTADTIGGKISEYAEKVAETLDPVYQKLRPGDDHTAEKKESSGEGVIERVKDAVGSWLGKPQDSAYCQYSTYFFFPFLFCRFYCLSAVRAKKKAVKESVEVGLLKM
ncbi:stress-responsive family protein, partial [Striga asiatica]